MNINQLAGWFYNNNELVRRQNNSFHLMMLCFYAKEALLLKNMNVIDEEIDFYDEKIIVSLDSSYLFSKDEEHILKIINKYYGFKKTEVLAKSSDMQRLLNGEKVTDEAIQHYLSRSLGYAFRAYENDDFDEEVLVLNDNLFFFVKNDTNLTNEEVEKLKAFDPLYDSGCHVCRHNGEMVVF